MAAALERKQPDVELCFIGSRKPGDRDLVEAAGIKFYPITAGKLRRYLAWENVADMVWFMVGCAQAYSLVRRFRPDVVFAKGGYVSLPVIVAAGWSKVPVIACESDAVVGLSARLGWRWIQKVGTAFPVEVVARNTPRIGMDKLIFTGLPVDEAWKSAAAHKPFANGRPTLLIMGGSQGASFLNQVVAGAIEDILAVCNVVHYTGRLSYSTMVGMYESLDDTQKAGLIVRDFDTEDFRGFVKGADLVLGRAGSSALELAAIGKPAILVPLPGSAANHQEHNAKFLAQIGGVRWLRQDRDLADKLMGEIKALIADRSKLAAMGEAMARFGEVNFRAADNLADIILAARKS